jgi:hypothetical protein
MLGALLFLVFIAAFIYAMTRTEKKLKTALITLGSMLGAALIEIPLVTFIGTRMGITSHDVGFMAGSLSIPIALLASIFAALIASGRTKKKLASEVNHT